MFSQAELETILSAGIVLLFLAASVDIWWMLNGWEIEAIRRTVARLVKRCERDHRVESYIRGLRRLAEDE